MSAKIRNKTITTGADSDHRVKKNKYVNIKVLQLNEKPSLWEVKLGHTTDETRYKKKTGKRYDEADKKAL